MSPEVRSLAGMASNHVVVPLTGTKVSLEAAKALPFHHRLAVVSSMATSVPVTVASVPAAAVPVIMAVQSAP